MINFQISRGINELQQTVELLTRIFHKGSGESLNYPLRFSLLYKNQDDFHHDKVYQGKIDITTLSKTNC
jgi:hypothetical protein